MTENEPGIVDLGDSLGADGGISAQCISVYVPDRDRDGNEIGTQRKWVLEALSLLGRTNGGATAMPACEGVWLNEDGEEIREHPVVVYSFILYPDAFLQNLPQIRDFLHRMGRETNQGEVAFEFDGCFHRIRHFDDK